jgi:hypothetical protein
MSEPKLMEGNFERLRGGHRHLPGNGTLPGSRPSRGVTSLERVKSRDYIPPARPKFKLKAPKR